MTPERSGLEAVSTGAQSQRRHRGEQPFSAMPEPTRGAGLALAAAADSLVDERQRRETGGDPGEPPPARDPAGTGRAALLGLAGAGQEAGQEAGSHGLYASAALMILPCAMSASRVAVGRPTTAPMVLPTDTRLSASEMSPPAPPAPVVESMEVAL